MTKTILSKVNIGKDQRDYNGMIAKLDFHEIANYLFHKKYTCDGCQKKFIPTMDWWLLIKIEGKRFQRIMFIENIFCSTSCYQIKKLTEQYEKSNLCYNRWRKKDN